MPEPENFIIHNSSLILCLCGCKNMSNFYGITSEGETIMPKNRDAARANLENLYRIFTVPEAPDSTLGAIDQAIADDVAGFLQTHIVAIERNLEEIEANFSSSTIPGRTDLRLRIHRIRQGEPGRPVGPYRRPRLCRPHDLGAPLLHAAPGAPHDRPQPEPGQGGDLQ